MAEKEYIEREALIEEAKHNKAVCQAIADIVDVKDIINNTPVADVAPVRHGEWQEINGIFSCSRCGYSFEHEGYIPFFNYCSNCGAKLC